jgi:hypothetical protein
MVLVSFSAIGMEKEVEMMVDEEESLIMIRCDRGPALVPCEGLWVKLFYHLWVAAATCSYRHL